MQQALLRSREQAQWRNMVMTALHANSVIHRAPRELPVPGMRKIETRHAAAFVLQHLVAIDWVVEEISHVVVQ